jgi:hypothetical protein
LLGRASHREKSNGEQCVRHKPSDFHA